MSFCSFFGYDNNNQIGLRDGKFILCKRCNEKKYKTHLIPCGCLYFTVEKNNSLNTDAKFNLWL